MDCPPRRLAAAILLAVWPGLGPIAASAEAWSALAIGNPGPGAEGAFADAFHAAEGLRAAGLQRVVLEREATADAMLGAVAALAGAPAVVIYLALPLAPGPDGPILGAGRGAAADGRLALGALLRTIAAAGTRRIVVLVEDCGGPQGQAGRIGLPPEPEGAGLFLAASAGPDGDCGTAARLTDALRAAGPGPLALDEVLAGGWIGARMAEATVLEGADAAPVTRVVDAQSPVLAVVEAGPADAVSAIAPVSAAEALTPAAAPAGAPEDGEVVLFVAPPQAQLAALPTAEGLPEPSIIVGLIENTAATFGTVDDAAPEVTSNEIAFDNLDARRAFRAQDPDLFAALVESGAFDPPEVQLARVLQSELARMGCYRSAIDGDWGNGSRGAVDRYFAEVDGVEPAGREPSVELFRQIILRDDVACPEPEPAVATTQPRRQAASGGTAQRQQPAASQPARTQPAPQQPTARRPSALEPRGFGSPLGVFR